MHLALQNAETISRLPLRGPFDFPLGLARGFGKTGQAAEAPLFFNGRRDAGATKSTGRRRYEASSFSAPLNKARRARITARASRMTMATSARAMAPAA
jgi:hypothetical protein